MALIPIGYCGKKDEETDHLYGTNLVWKSGVVHDVEEEAAKKLLTHPDVWFDARSRKQQKSNPIEAEAPRSKRLEDDEVVPMPVKVHEMPKEDLIVYARTQFNEMLDDSKPVEELRSEVVRLMNSR